VEAEEEEEIWKPFNDQLIKIAQSNLEKDQSPLLKLTFKKYLALAFNNAAVYFEKGSNKDLALELYTKSLKLFEDIHSTNGMADALGNIGFHYSTLGNFQKAEEYYEKALVLHNENKDTAGITTSLTNLAANWKHKGDLPKALEMQMACLHLQELSGDKKRIGISENNIGNTYLVLGDLKNAIEYLNRSLVSRNSIHDVKGIAIVYSNLAGVYLYSGDLNKALEFQFKSLEMIRSQNDLSNLPNSLNGISITYGRLKDLKKSEEYSLQAIEAAKKMNNKMVEGLAKSNLAGVYKDRGEISKALSLYKESLSILEMSAEKRLISFCYSNIGDCLAWSGDKKGAIIYGKKGLKLAQEIGAPDGINFAATMLYKVYKSSGDFTSALECKLLAVKMSDSIQSISNKKAAIKNQLKFEYEKKAAADSVARLKERQINNVELAKQRAEIKAKKNQQVALFGGLILVILFSIFMFNRFKITQKQKMIIEHQKEEVEKQKILVEDKQREVLDSIRYAKRIQQAQMPSAKKIESAFLKLKR
jgi:tetratricopeptide (TPR) repeat protein